MKNFRKLIPGLPIDVVVSLSPVPSKVQSSKYHEYFTGEPESVTMYLPGELNKDGSTSGPLTACVMPVSVLYAIHKGVSESRYDTFSIERENTIEEAPNDPDDLPF